MKNVVLFLLSLMYITGCGHSDISKRPVAPHVENLVESVFSRLRSVRSVKKEKISQLLKSVQNTAKNIEHDTTMLDFFFSMRDITMYGESALNAEGIEVETCIDNYKCAINSHYIYTYLKFYDILFVDSSGYVFYSIRKEDEYKANLYSNSFLDTSITEHMQDSTSGLFMDYRYYVPAKKPIAFFIIPVVRSGVREGWFVVKYTIRALNSLLVDYKELGETGEVYLVNRNHEMLTDSRFSGSSSRLTLHVDTKAVFDALINKSSDKIITDYREIRVLSSYENFNIWNNKWAVIAEIDEDEVITEHYKSYRNYYRDSLLEYISSAPCYLRPERDFDGLEILVDMNCTEKAESTDVLTTVGIATCTGLCISFPGRFGYIAHIAPHDKIYGTKNLTNLVKAIVRRIKRYDIYLYELRKLRFVIVANHSESIDALLEKLMRYGVFLSQIKFAYKPDAAYANITFSPLTNRMDIEWVSKSDNPERTLQYAGDVKDMGTAIKHISGYNNHVKKYLEESLNNMSDVIQ